MKLKDVIMALIQ